MDMLNYEQIEDFMYVYEDFDGLNDSNVISYMRNLPKEWNEYIINSKLSKGIKNRFDKSEMKDLTERCMSISSQLGFEVEEQIVKIHENQDEFYLSNVTFLRTAVEILEKIELGKIPEDILTTLNPITIEYIKEICLGKENYEILKLLKDYNL
jgi:hypothetical protein